MRSRPGLAANSGTYSKRIFALMRNRFLVPSTFLLVFFLGICSQASGQNSVISTVAGSGPSCGIFQCGSFGGDGAPAVSASLYGPSGVAVDASGNLYIADNYNNRIRK